MLEWDGSHDCVLGQVLGEESQQGSLPTLGQCGEQLPSILLNLGDIHILTMYHLPQ
jgi:hypothetical protein